MKKIFSVLVFLTISQISFAGSLDYKGLEKISKDNTFMDGEGIPYPDDKITDKKARRDKPAQEATTLFRCLATTEQDFAIDRYPCSRFSLVECKPLSGRKHQIRRHLKHISHPIIGDAKHGKGNYNRYFKDNLQAGRLLLHAKKMQFVHPYSKDVTSVNAPFDVTFQNLFERFDWLKFVD